MVLLFGFVSLVCVKDAEWRVLTDKRYLPTDGSNMNILGLLSSRKSASPGMKVLSFFSPSLHSNFVREAGSRSHS